MPGRDFKMDAALAIARTPSLFAVTLIAVAAFRVPAWAQSQSPDATFDPSPLTSTTTADTRGLLTLKGNYFTQPPSVAASPPAPAADGDEKEANTGQDPTKPLTRLDIRLKYQDLPNGRSAVVPTLLADIPFPIGESGWKLGTRFDLPFIASDVRSPDNPAGDWRFGASDALTQVLLITPPQGRWQFGFGTQIIFPTGSEDQMGTGKWQLAPMVAGIYAVPEISKGSFVGVLVKDQFSVAGADDRKDINDLVVQPLFNVNLPDRWFLTVAPEMRFNLEDDGAAFIPFDLLVGKMINPKTVMSVELKAPLLDDYKQYDFEVEFRIGFFF